jgi:threonylcarbamoyladenosine tRNA methylthiotransferase MtaB
VPVSEVSAPDGSAPDVITPDVITPDLAASPRALRAAFVTFGCKANQYDTDQIRHAVLSSVIAEIGSLEAGRSALGRAERESPERERPSASTAPDLVVINTCAVTHEAEQDARRQVQRIHRDHPETRVIVVGCSAALDPEPWKALRGVASVVGGHVPESIASAVRSLRREGVTPALVTIRDQRLGVSGGPQVPEVAPQQRTRGWLGIQDGCDRKCAFCATRIARGKSRSRSMEAILAEAAALARVHPEIVLTGIHIGHYGTREAPLSTLLARLLEGVPSARFRLGSLEATEVDDALIRILAAGATIEAGSAVTPEGGGLAPHLHMPLQSGADPVLRRMRRWHTREDYRRRTLEIVEALEVKGPTTPSGAPVLGLGADIITGFPGETDADHRDTVRLVEELPFTYLHVFPFSARSGTVAAALARESPVPRQVAAERARELRELGQAKGLAYLDGRVGGRAHVVVERPRADGTVFGLTEDFLRLPVMGETGGDGARLRTGRIERSGDKTFVRLG